MGFGLHSKMGRSEVKESHALTYGRNRISLTVILKIDGRGLRGEEEKLIMRQLQ